MVVILALLSVILVSLISLIGILALSIQVGRLRKALTYFVSFAAGGLLGDAILHLLPEISGETGFTLQVSFSILIGIAIFFLFEKVLHWHHYHAPHSKETVHTFAVMNLLGDSVHNFIDGLIIGGSYLVSIPAGIATTIAVVFHEIPQEIGDFAVLLEGGFTQRKALFFNFLTAVTAIIGAGAAFILNLYVENLIRFLIPFAAGGFIYIAGSDLIPELHKEARISRSLIQFATFLLGILVMASLLLLE
ncbi:ZIP family metal transporter [Candidatus Woesearchaeota archaeon]|nr:ZIP family metal transporter [Candidatus Woesearchaeota archaeon]